MDELAKAHIDSAIEKEDIEDGTELGTEAARLAIAAYITPGEPRTALGEADHSALSAAEDS